MNMKSKRKRDKEDRSWIFDLLDLGWLVVEIVLYIPKLIFRVVKDF